VVNKTENTRDRVALTQNELESKLLSAANSLRGPVDPADFKQYVFPLLFLKRLSDHWDAEQVQAAADYAPKPVPAEAYADYHRFDIPEGCHWSDLRKVAENVGYALQLILDRIQEANPSSLAGIFGEVAWANKDRLPEHALLRLVEIFNGIPLDPATVSHDMLGQAYEYLLREFAEASGKKAGEFFTPRAVVRLLTRLLDPQPGESIYDPACGSAGMLVEAVNEVAEGGGDTRTLRLYGQEVNLTTAAIARMNLFMHDIEDFKILRGDTLREPKFRDSEGQLTRFDVVLANPPFSLKDWGAEGWASDPFQRAFCGVPPASLGDYAWIQHMLASINDHGRVGVVMPHGVLFRGVERGIRECILAGDLLSCVIALPPNLFYSTQLPACLMVFKARKSEAERGNVLLVDASKRFDKGRRQNHLRPEDVNAVLTVVGGMGAEIETDVASRLVSLGDIKDNGGSLNFPTYLGGAASDVMALPDAWESFLDASAEAAAAEGALRTAVEMLLSGRGEE
jgi:type I restriction enzyme M protein